MFWKRFTTRGAVASMVFGTVATILLIYLSPTVQMDILKNNGAVFPLRNPGIVTISLSFFLGIVVSLLSPEKSSEEKFAILEEQIHFGAETASVD
jgi:cation/acetate symporter